MRTCSATIVAGVCAHTPNADGGVGDPLIFKLTPVVPARFLNLCQRAASVSTASRARMPASESCRHRTAAVRARRRHRRNRQSPAVRARPFSPGPHGTVSNGFDAATMVSRTFGTCWYR